jgi:hypothetical protein
MSENSNRLILNQLPFSRLIAADPIGQPKVTELPRVHFPVSQSSALIGQVFGVTV